MERNPNTKLPRYAHDEWRQNFINYPVNVTFVFAFAICISVQVTRISNWNGVREIIRIARKTWPNARWEFIKMNKIGNHRSRCQIKSFLAISIPSHASTIFFSVRFESLIFNISFWCVVSFVICNYAIARIVRTKLICRLFIASARIFGWID